MNTNSSPALKAFFVGSGILYVVLTIGFFFQMPWATALWPWPDGRLSYVFIASITAAIAGPLFWIGLSGEFGAARGGAINLLIAGGGMAVYLFILYGRTGDQQILITAIASIIFALINLGIYFWSSKQPIRDRRAMPGLVKASFVLFTAVLILVGSLLVLRAPVVFPWPLKPESSVIFGLIFLGAAAYFAIAAPSPWWHSARGQLIGFLAYDLILIGPFLAHLGTVKPEFRLSLILYLLVLAYSGGLAIYYLFINKVTRPWRIDSDVEV